MNPFASVGANARPKPISQNPKIPETASRKFFITTELQCCLFEADTSTKMKPSCMKKIRAAEVITQDEEAPVLMPSRTFVCASVKVGAGVDSTAGVEVGAGVEATAGVVVVELGLGAVVDVVVVVELGLGAVVDVVVVVDGLVVVYNARD